MTPPKPASHKGESHIITPHLGRHGKTILRWICVAPAALLGLVLAPLLVGALVWLNSSVAYGPTWMEYILAYVTAAIVSGACFVHWGARAAPNHQPNVAMVLVTILSCISALAIVIECTQHNWLDAGRVAIAWLAGIVTAVHIHQDKT
jgi:hypothetical protein